MENAEFFEKAGAAVVLRPAAGGRGAGAEELAALVRALARNPERLAAMSAAAAEAARIDGALLIARVLKDAVSPAAGGELP